VGSANKTFNYLIYMKYSPRDCVVSQTAVKDSVLSLLTGCWKAR